jgi:muramidase (phage lysozyme)
MIRSIDPIWSSLDGGEDNNGIENLKKILEQHKIKKKGFSKNRRFFIEMKIF